ncbi:hypothetical protein [Pleurocapsa sp. PCC 7319]|uniref:hypothetical protein n=1 Tax=Pleurocapsa sp. PCC 7319 TaxID=118161 RepID=UPI00035EBD1F|nr:hypothetical protein [Pleurocapsa sp. PCC 7319]
MKAIVANVLFGSIFGCLILNYPAHANPLVGEHSGLEIPTSPILSVTAFSNDKLNLVPQVLNFVDRIVTVNKSDNLNFAVAQDKQVIFRDSFSANGNFSDNPSISLEKGSYSHQDQQGKLMLGFQQTFWPSKNNQKYWGLTTIEQWGEHSNQKQKLNLRKLNYTNLAPTLPSGSSALTVSGGGNKNLAKKADSSREFEKFRGGVTFHSGVANNVTMGVGFVYEDLLVGFTQLTYDSDRIPVRTTVSLLAKESGLDVYSHVRFKPAENFVFNYYHDEEKQKFDFNWGMISGFTLTAKGNSQNESLSTGVKIAIHNDFFALTAQAAMDNQQNLHWKLDSRIGSLQFIHKTQEQKHNSELNINLLDSKPLGIKCSAYVKYETRQVKQNQEEFTVWGGRLNSQEKVGKNKHRWSLDLGYGYGAQGQGAIASSSVALEPNMILKLTYQEISRVSDDTKIKLQLSSK